MLDAAAPRDQISGETRPVFVHLAALAIRVNCP
jgi:hypothetical protein